jgi:hypothetical protein
VDRLSAREIFHCISSPYQESIIEAIRVVADLFWRRIAVPQKSSGSASLHMASLPESLQSVLNLDMDFLQMHDQGISPLEVLVHNSMKTLLMIAARLHTAFNPMPETVLESFRKEMANLPVLFFSEEPRVPERWRVGQQLRGTLTI